MQIHNARPTAATYDQHDDVLDCRMAMLGLNLHTLEGGNSKAFEEIMRRCMSCSCREACTLDLKRDPNDPVWETYCPIAAVLNALAEAWWLGRAPSHAG